MVLLLDTHVLLWGLDAPERLPREIVGQLESPETTVYFSAASIWEIAIKASLGKIDFPYSPEAIAQAARDTGFVELPVRAEHGAKVAQLPLHHRDPFDRLLIAQSLLLPAQLLTADAALVPYTELVRLV
ncbi:MAG: twitching motility protein PilT [Thiobacillus sp. 63-78]|uniref:type II toxin-antitoxin system VapC family toxin n=1 Tax=Thiobacillus sp. 63-78 TaxID=1895859 RepID=UPI000963A61D|nr:type II toxin-antitoxin system VapC family toxin [Thiobacillus sp. 63-78]OJZ08042.1 MAG: twitching motility protein PilT [Thiobacillus sp. 63-78]